MSAPAYEFKIGTSVGGMTLLKSLATPVIWPRDEFDRYPVVKDLANGGTRGMGNPQANWYWDIIQGAQYTQLKTFMTALTTYNVYIRTRDETNSFHTYLCDMNWMPRPQWSAGRVLKFEIRFVNLVQQS